MACRETNNTDIILPLCAVKENGVISAAKVNSVFYCRFAEDTKRAARRAFVQKMFACHEIFEFEKLHFAEWVADYKQLMLFRSTVLFVNHVAQ